MQKVQARFPTRSDLHFFCSIPFAGSSIIIFGGFHFDVLELAFVSVVEAIYALVGSWVLSLLYPDAISPDGVYGHSFWGRRRLVCWRDIASARSIRILNVRLLRVSATDGEVTWLGLFPARKAEFL